MPIYPYSFQLPPLNVQDIPNDGAPGEFLGINVGGQLDWLPAGGGGGSGDMLAANNLSELTNFATARTNIGLGTASTPTFANLTLTSPSLSSSAPVTISQTWNGTGSTVFTAFKVNATSTASDPTSKLLDLQLGGVSQLSVSRGGSILSKVGVIAANGTPNAAGLSLELFYSLYGLGVDSNGSIVFFRNGLAKSRAGLGIAASSDSSIGWTNAAHVGGDASLDTILVRDGAPNTLALRNGAAAQTFNIYGTYSTSPSLAYSRLAISCDTSGNATLTTQSTGVAGTVSINGVPVGLGKGNVATNVAIGTSALNAVSTGSQNVAIGYESSLVLTTASSNVSIGFRALRANTGAQNVAIGTDSMQVNSTGTKNTALGFDSLNGNSTGGSNTGIGSESLRGNTTGSNNIAIGVSAGRFITGSLGNVLSNNSVYLGASTKAAASGETNQIVIGYDATGIGDHSVVLGNDSITKTALKGNVGIGTTAPGAKLHVAGNGLFGENTGVVTATPVNVSFGGTVGQFAPGNKGNLKWDLYNDGTTALRYGIGMSANLMEFQTGSLGAFGFYPGNTTTSALHIITGGNVGIGTTSPSEKLHVLGGKVLFGDAADVTGTAGNGDLTLRAYRSPQIHISANTSSSVLYGLNIELNNNIYAGLLLNLNSGEVKIGGLSVGGYFPTFYADNVERMRITAAGNVGIGTTSPTSKLDVAGAVTAAGYYTATSGGVSLVANGLWQQGTGHLTLASGAILGWSGAANVNTDQPGDTRLLRDEAYHLALRNGTNGQKFSVYGTYPGAAWERFTITAPTSGNVLLGTYKGTGGIARGLEFQTDGVTRMSLHPTLGTLDLPAAGTSAGVQQINAARIIYAGEGYRVGNTYQVVFSNGTDYSRGLGASSSGGLAVTNGSTGGQSLQFTEMTAPAAPSANSVRIYAEDDGTGKTRLMALFATGVAQQIAIEP